jgi:hypothetical protein
MNDRFKFRVWDNDRKEYRKYFDVCFSEMYGMWVTNNGHDVEDALEKFIIEQCTGLRDKNGKLIFEGDILRVKLNSERIENMEVFWWTGGGFHAKNHNGAFYTVGVICHESGIVGNIHEGVQP